MMIWIIVSLLVVGTLLFIREEKKLNRQEVNSKQQSISFCQQQMFHYEAMIRKLKEYPIEDSDWFLNEFTKQKKYYEERSKMWLENLECARKTLRHRLFGY